MRVNQDVLVMFTAIKGNFGRKMTRPVEIGIISGLVDSIDEQDVTLRCFLYDFWETRLAFW
jgi:hypothetical protein